LKFNSCSKTVYDIRTPDNTGIESMPKIIINDTVYECCSIKLLPYILFEKYYIF